MGQRSCSMYYVSKNFKIGKFDLDDSMSVPYNMYYVADTKEECLYWIDQNKIK